MKSLQIISKQFFLIFISLVSFLVGSAQIQTARNISMTANSKGFYEYLPEGYGSGTQTYPLIIFVHGQGELGNGVSQLSKVIGTGLPALIQQGKFPKSFTVNGQVQRFIVLSPQFVAWPKADDINNMIDYATRTYRVNTSKIYVTGLSMGGGATWEFAANANLYNKKIAAIVPICGAAGANNTKGNRIGDANLPVWATHNDGDGTVPVSWTKDWISFILARNPNAPVKMTIFQASGHDAWTKTYDPSFKENNMNIYEWMLQYSKGTPAPLPNQAPKANAGSDVTITLPANSAQLNGNSSSDPDGTIKTYSWSKVSGPTQFAISNSAIVNPVISNLAAGSYTFQLTVTDNAGATATDNILVTVNAAPSGGGGTNPGTAIKVNIFGGVNPYNNSEWNNWNIGAGTVSRVASATFKYSSGTASAIKATISYSEKVVDNGTSYSSTVIPTEVLRYTSYAVADRTILLTGLTPSKKYDIELYASRSMNSGNSTTFVIGTVSKTVATYRNLTQKIVFTGTAADSKGQILVTIKKTAGTYNYINGFTLTESAATTTTTTAKLSTTEEGLLAMPVSFEVSPSSVSDKFTLNIMNAYRGALAIQLLDAAGTVKKEFSSNKDQDVFSGSFTVNDLPAATYTVRVQMGEAVETVKVTKL